MEFRLDATGDPVEVKDLGIVVGPDPVWVSRGDLEASDCARALIRIGKIRLSKTPRTRVARKPQPKRPMPPSVVRSRPNGRSAPKKAPPAPQVSLAEAQKMAQRAAEEAAQMAVSALGPMILSVRDNPNLDNRIEDAISRALGSVRFASPSGEGSVGSSPSGSGPALAEPVYIPSGIVSAESESLKVKSESTEGGGLSDAASALKALRKKK